MKLPRFPIRKSLIPYDDLGIQEVSADNQLLGEDIPLTIAAMSGYGPNGSRIAQFGDKGELTVNDIYESPKFGDYSLIHIASGIHVPDAGVYVPINISQYHRVNFLLHITNPNPGGTLASFFLVVEDLQGNKYNTDSFSLNIVPGFGYFSIDSGYAGDAVSKNHYLFFQGQTGSGQFDVDIDALVI